MRCLYTQVKICELGSSHTHLIGRTWNTRWGIQPQTKSYFSTISTDCVICFSASTAFSYSFSRCETCSYTCRRYQSFYFLLRPWHCLIWSWDVRRPVSVCNLQIKTLNILLTFIMMSYYGRYALQVHVWALQTARPCLMVRWRGLMNGGAGTSIAM